MRSVFGMGGVCVSVFFFFFLYWGSFVILASLSCVPHHVFFFSSLLNAKRMGVGIWEWIVWVSPRTYTDFGMGLVAERWGRIEIGGKGNLGF